MRGRLGGGGRKGGIESTECRSLNWKEREMGGEGERGREMGGEGKKL